MAEEYDVEKVWVGWVLQEKPDTKIILTFCSCFTILNSVNMIKLYISAFYIGVRLMYLHCEKKCK